MSDFSQRAEIVNPNGLHARPAGKIVAIASSFECEVTLPIGRKVQRALRRLSSCPRLATYLLEISNAWRPYMPTTMPLR